MDVMSSYTSDVFVQAELLGYMLLILIVHHVSM
jgi:hypothetical protein